LLLTSGFSFGLRPLVNPPSAQGGRLSRPHRLAMVCRGTYVHSTRPAPRGYRWVFVPRFWHWRAKRYIEASDYGKKAFAFLVRDKRR